MDRTDTQIQDRLKFIETEIISEAETLSGIRALIQENWEDPAAERVTEALDRQIRLMEERASELVKKISSDESEEA